MRGFELVTLSVLLLTAQQLASGSPAPSLGLADSLLSGFNTALEQSSSAEVGMQIKSALAAAGCSKDAVDLLRVSSGKSCIQVFQATVSYQQFFLNVIYAMDKMKVYYDYSCFTGEESYIAELKCYLDNLNTKMTVLKIDPLYTQMKRLVDEINSIVDLYKASYQKCIEEESSVKYSIGSEEFSSLHSLVKSHCPAATSVEALRKSFSKK
ncbi:hypothetical protein LSTR_LSTR003016 [Laodelphax striatellus]|uniref:Uncharacterized protein n=1 Tax=Laodelphax striatellus TaxID=195883 RepID=A0A482XUA3_LAOST|nr:hypothetical protein LSTR_LSTR003016 [Laodelphax striatellus]